ncbi:MAG: hypothetical protein F6K48_20710 [Okeania sp. SIO3H1]|nr:hypothetical protein [Okeania sp. SIO3H1]
MSSASLYEFKRGSTFSFAATLTVFNTADEVVPLTNWTVTAGGSVPEANTTFELSAAIANPTGPATLTLSATAAETLLWSKGVAHFDFRLVDDQGNVVHSGTGRFKIIDAITVTPDA